MGFLAVVICQPLGISYSRGRSPRITDDKLTFVQIPTEYRKPYGGSAAFALGILLLIKQHIFIFFPGISRNSSFYMNPSIGGNYMEVL